MKDNQRLSYTIRKEKKSKEINFYNKYFLTKDRESGILNNDIDNL